MVVRRDSLRAQTDFFSPMTGNKGTNIRYADAPRRKDTYGSKVKSRLADIKNVRGTRVNPIEAVFTKLIKTEDPFTQIDRKKSYAPEEEQDGLEEALGGAAEAAEQVVGDAVGEVREVVRSTGQRASERRAAQQLKRQEQRKADQAALDKRFAGVETGLSNLGKDYKAQEQRAIDNMAKFRAEQSDKFKASDNRFKNFSIAQMKRDIDQDIAQRKAAQDAKTYEQNRLKQRELTQSRLKGIETGLSNLGKDYKAQEQAAIDNMAKFRAEQAAKFSGVDKRLGITETGLSNLGKNYKAQEQAAIDNMAKFRAGLTADIDKKISEVKKMYGQGGLPLGTTAPRQVVSGMTTGVKDGVKVEAKPKVAINASSFLQKNVRGSGIPSKSGKDESARPKEPKQVSNLPSNYKATEAEAFRTAKAYKEAKAIAERNPNVSVTVDSKGKPVAKAEQKTRSEAGTAARTAQGNAARVKTNAVARAQAAAVSRKLSGKSISQTKAANTASMKAAAAARHASFKSQRAAGTHARTASAQRARNKAAAKARAKAAAKRRRSKKKCDITIKYDISTLTNMNLLRDDLANVAYFVKELQETI